MNRAWKLAALFVVFGFMRLDCTAQVYVRFDNETQARGPFNSGDPIRSSDPLIGNIPTTVTLIHVFAMNPATTDIGRIELSGDPQFSRQTELQVLIADAGLTSFPQLSETSFSIGGRHWHGIEFTDVDLRDKARLAAGLQGDLVRRVPGASGSAQVGQVFRLQFGGTIREPVIANAGNTQFGQAIRHIALVSGIADTGSIDAQAGDIFDITVGPLPTTLGIRGSIHARDGIGDIRVMGPIQIAAPGGIRTEGSIIGSIIAGDPTTSTYYDIDATIDGGSQAYIHRIAGNNIAGGVAGFILAQPFNGGSFPPAAIEAQGNLTAPIRMSGSIEWDVTAYGRIADLETAGDLRANVYAGTTIGRLAVGVNIGPRTDRPRVEINAVQRIDLLTIGNSTEIDDTELGYEVEISTAEIGILEVALDFFGRIQGYQTPSAKLLGHVIVGRFVKGELRLNPDPGAYIEVHHWFEPDDARDTGGNPGPGEGGLFLYKLPATSWVTIGEDLNMGTSTSTPAVYLEPGLLAGPIIVGGNGPGRIWEGEVQVTATETLGPSQPQPRQAPDYEAPSGAYGGGSVGVVRFPLYDNDCVPPHRDEWDYEPPSGQELLNTQFSRFDNTTHSITPKEVTIRYRGPVRTNSFGGIPEKEPVQLWIWLHHYLWRNVTDQVTIELKRGNDSGFSREVVIHGNGTLLPSGYYAVVADTTTEDRLFCDKTFMSPPASVRTNIGPNSQYNFRLFRDCDQNNIADTDQVECGPSCVADYDDESGTGIPDGGVGIEDLLYYLTLFDAGDLHADVDNGSGMGVIDFGVGIEDLLYYLMHFDLGC
jgi:hypothetical protein